MVSKRRSLTIRKCWSLTKRDHQTNITILYELLVMSDQGGAGGTREPGGAIRTWVYGGAKAELIGWQAKVGWHDQWLEEELGDPLYWVELETGRPEINPHHEELSEEEPRDWRVSAESVLRIWLIFEEREAGRELWRPRRLWVGTWGCRRLWAALDRDTTTLDKRYLFHVNKRFCPN